MSWIWYKFPCSQEPCCSAYPSCFWLSIRVSSRRIDSLADLWYLLTSVSASLSLNCGGIGSCSRYFSGRVWCCLSFPISPSLSCSGQAGNRIKLWIKAQLDAWVFLIFVSPGHHRFVSSAPARQPLHHTGLLLTVADEDSSGFYNSALKVPPPFPSATTNPEHAAPFLPLNSLITMEIPVLFLPKPNFNMRGSTS